MSDTAPTTPTTNQAPPDGGSFTLEVADWVWAAFYAQPGYPPKKQPSPAPAS